MFISRILAITAVALMPILANAQEGQRAPGPASDGWEISVGGGGFYSPKYLGDDDYDLSLVPYIRIKKGEKFSATVQDGARYAIVDRDGLRIGPVARLNFGRNEDGSGTFRVAEGGTDDLLGLGDIDIGIGLGAFAEYNTGNLVLSVDARQALGGHDGLVGEISLRYKNKIKGYGPPLFYSIGPSVDFADSVFTNAFFGVDAVQSAASGLPQYQAKGGVAWYGIGATAITPLSDNITASFILNYERLAGSVADAPLVTQRGSPDQVFVGAFLSRTF